MVIRKFCSYKKGVISFASRVTAQNKFLIGHRASEKWKEQEMFLYENAIWHTKYHKSE